MHEDVIQLQYWLGMVGTIAFAATAVLAVIPRNIDLFGACVMGIVTAVGGGTLRDLILAVPVFWSVDLNYIWVALITSCIVFYANRFMTRRAIYHLMLYLDGLGIALFAIQAAQKVWSLNFGLPLAPILLGIITAIGGGLIRDVLAGHTTLLMKRELYAVPVTMGCTLYVVLLYWLPNWLPTPIWVINFACTAFIFCFRTAAIYWELQVPQWAMSRSRGG